MKKNFKIVIVNDEISDDIKKSIKFLKKNKINYIELRSIKGKNLLDHNIEEVKSLKKYLDNNNIIVAALASPLFKWFFCTPENNLEVDRFYFNPNLNTSAKKKYIRKAIEIANILGTKNIRIFSTINDQKI